jgi:hypothetical protein
METGLIFGLWAIIQIGIGVQFWYDAKEEWKNGNS